MKCEKCGETLAVTPGKSVNYCSNCGNKVVAQSSATAVDSVESALRYIVDNFGADMLLGNKVVTYFADITRGQLRDEKDLIKIFSDKGALDCLKGALQKSVSEQELSLKRAMSALPKFLKNSEDADAMLRSFAVALGWQLPKPQITVQSQTITQKPQTIQHTSAVITNETSRITPQISRIHRFANIDWRVLDVQGNKALLISDKIIELSPYNSEDTDITWENCMLREYLNNEFYYKLGAAKTAIAETHNTNPNNPWYGTNGGNTTVDKIFLLSLHEVCRYFGDSSVNISKKGNTGSEYYLDDSNNAKRIAKDAKGKPCWWWLRSPGHRGSNTTLVHGDGYVHIYGNIVYVNDLNNYFDGGVRPALWLNLNMKGV